MPSQAESLFELRPAEEAPTGENVPVVGAPLVGVVSGPERAPALAGRSAPPADAGSSRTGDAPPAAVTAGGPAAGLAERLIASEIYRQRRGTRAPLPDERVANMLTVLLARGGRASLDTLAARAGIPAHRIHGSVVALRRLLQVEGYPVVTIDPDGATVKLDVPLMVEQFGLEER
ncbi:hypothetical protein [Plantactinospora sp. KLBMP9567]|uniref:hypothetical protein n=1 Tax=Plantactinospora sp. KLBMP9567 TaxID=3085900 RepID=UPI00298233DB|nr:hypothetical protein [Plantactinospora sp. KLBMP9567]MDW5323923.1 hypothetical protein [Plantactinospora sp. KLBMP9567]